MALLEKKKKKPTKSINVLSKCSLIMGAGSDVPRLRSWCDQNYLTMGRAAEKAQTFISGKSHVEVKWPCV